MLLPEFLLCPPEHAFLAAVFIILRSGFVWASDSNKYHIPSIIFCIKIHYYITSVVCASRTYFFEWGDSATDN